MKFSVVTLVDITETKARRGDWSQLLKQQQNFNTMIQTIGLRANLAYDISPSRMVKDVKGLGFGSDHKGELLVWHWQFEVEADFATSVELLEQDFDLVPIITGLDETAGIKPEVFFPKNPRKLNIIFSLVDK